MDTPIRVARAAAGITQVRLAVDSELSPGTVASIEDAGDARLSQLLRIARVLGIDPYELASAQMSAYTQGARGGSR